MSNKERYNQIFMEAVAIGPDELTKNPSYDDLDSWDSIGHMTMVASLEDAFQIVLETDDIIGFNSYAKGMEILSKYGVAFE